MTHSFRNELALSCFDKKAGWSKTLKGLGEDIVSQFRSPTSDGILGKAIRDKARSGGLTFHSTSAQDAEYLFAGKKKLPGVLNKIFPDTGRQGAEVEYRILSKFNQFPKTYLTPDSTISDISKAKGIIFSPSQSVLPKELERIRQNTNAPIWQPEAPSFKDDKWLEYLAFKKVMPKTKLLSHVFKAPVTNKKEWHKALNTLRREFGPEWIIKARSGNASDVGDLIMENQNTEALRNILRRGDLSQAIVQTRHPIKKIPAWQKAIDDAVAPGANFNRGTREVRVHTVNGKILPYGSQERGSILGALQATMFPWRNKYVRDAETHVNSIIKQMPKRLKHKGVYGYDIGFKQDATPFMIEANASTVGGNVSGILDMTQGIDSMSAAIQGRLPLWVKARNTAYGGAALGGAGLYATRSQNVKQSSEEQSELTKKRFVGASQMVGAALAADTAMSFGKSLAIGNGLSSLAAEVAKNRSTLADPLSALRIMDRYGDLAGEGSRLRVMGIPVGRIFERIPPSAMFLDKQPLKHSLMKLFGMEHRLPKSALKLWNESSKHYGGFVSNPTDIITKEILSNDWKSIPKNLINSNPGYGRDAERIWKSKATGKLVDRFSGVLDKYYRTNSSKLRSQLRTPITRWAKDMFLAGQSPAARSFNMASALDYGPGFYGPASKRLGRVGLPVAALAALGLGASGAHNLLAGPIEPTST